VQHALMRTLQPHLPAGVSGRRTGLRGFCCDSRRIFLLCIWCSLWRRAWGCG
ncbi:hypothetical protein NDU88_002822, partial [Pleurodeles waltl]